MEAECNCPYCGEPISFWIDDDGGRAQTYVEDCSVCCRPLQLHVSIDEDGQAALHVARSDE